PRDERQNVAARRDATKCLCLTISRGRVYRSGRGAALLWIRGFRPVVAGRESSAARVGIDGENRNAELQLCVIRFPHYAHDSKNYGGKNSNAQSRSSALQSPAFVRPLFCLRVLRLVIPGDLDPAGIRIVWHHNTGTVGGDLGVYAGAGPWFLG